MPAFVDRLLLDARNQRVLRLTFDEIVAIQKKALSAIPGAENGMKRNSLRHIIDVTSKVIDESHGTGSIPRIDRLYQFKITLNESAPSIWRRIQVRNCTLDKLHEHIQTAMGWSNSHLHQFKIAGARHGDPELLNDGFEDFDCIDSTVTKIVEVIPEDGKQISFVYEYDFGDGWEHEVLFEGCLRAEKGGRYPICVEGERACPPENVGGIWGYSEFLDAIADPEHEEHAAFREWIGLFDPEKFDAEESSKMMRRGLPDWRR